MTTPHITVCICTYKRSGPLNELLRGLEHQRTNDRFTYDIVVADNDSARTAAAVVREFASVAGISVTYCSEPEQNIALARNRACAHARGEFVAFIDDDELPARDWLLSLFEGVMLFQVDGVLGPVLARFEQPPPEWVTRGKFFDRPRRQTGRRVRWPEARTGNVLLAAALLRGPEPPFRRQFGSGGEDVDFFRRMITSGRRFVWCDEAVVHEVVPGYRCTRRFLMRRALLRGSIFPKQSGHRVRNALKSIVAVPCYTIALPLLAIVGQHVFIAYLVKLLDHASRLLALAGIPLSTERET